MRERSIQPYMSSGLAVLLTAILIAIATAQAAQPQDVTITSREIVERLARLEEGQKHLEAQLGQRIDDLRQVTLWGFGVTFAGIFALIGFVMWDRRTAISPAIRRIERVEEVLRRFSKDNPELAESLRNLGIL